jgi:hypothetical protein
LSFNVTYQAVNVKGQVAEEWREYRDWNECGGIWTQRLEAVDAAEGVKGKDVLSWKEYQVVQLDVVYLSFKVRTSQLAV